jgi:DNA-binding SARP family transcriptional activator
MGEVGLFVGDEHVQLRSAKELALLAILAEAHPRPITRTYLLPLLWPTSEPDRARKSLNQAVYALRKVVGQDAIRAQLDLLALDGPGWSCDLWELDAHVAEVARTKAPLRRFARTGRLPVIQHSERQSLT